MKYFSFEGGFWGIESDDNQYLPLNMPEQLKTKDAQVTCTINIDEEATTMVSWGQPCHIFSFSTLTPRQKDQDK